MLPMTTESGASSLMTANVGLSLGSASAALWLPVPMASPNSAAALASLRLISSASWCPPVIPAMTKGALRSWPRNRVDRSTSAIDTSGNEAGIRCTSSHNADLPLWEAEDRASSMCCFLRLSISVIQGKGRQPNGCASGSSGSAKADDECSNH